MRRRLLAINQLCIGCARNSDLLRKIHWQPRHNLDCHWGSLIFAKEMALLKPVQHINDGRVVRLHNVIIDDEAVIVKHCGVSRFLTLQLGINSFRNCDHRFPVACQTVEVLSVACVTP